MKRTPVASLVAKSRTPKEGRRSIAAFCDVRHGDGNRRRDDSPTALAARYSIDRASCNLLAP
jgi:hypothetical protein